MNTKTLVFASLILLLSLGCDDSDSELKLNVVASSFDAVGQTVAYTADGSSTEGISSILITGTITENIDSEPAEVHRYFSTPSAATTFSHDDVIFIGNQTGRLILTAVLTADDGEVATHSDTIEVVQDLSAYVDVTFKLQYDDRPLVLFTPYDYPGGYTINFTRYSTYLSDIQLDEASTVPTQVVWAPISDNNVDEASAAAGYTVRLTAPPGDYRDISFALGISPELNAMEPADFPSGHPLAAPGEYWLSWRSYVFTKIEGNVDTDGDGSVDQSFALHLGGDNAYSRIGSDMDLRLATGASEALTISIDLMDWLTSVPDGPYDLIGDGSIHSLSHQPLIDQLLANYQDQFIITK